MILCNTVKWSLGYMNEWEEKQNEKRIYPELPFIFQGSLPYMEYIYGYLLIFKKL